ncbi:DUF3168 domain-containing protein [Comamonas sp. NyZ500]|uniref:DUF3168 domain-containing protein n=1 Tax=Comamonas sp. NyZ500 TaxID=2795732 RepID=UPI00192C7EAE|nr:DUF3168 domain-containing protein [Comamonas sp. NyZ500]MBL5979046.1 DUF3168 domain-containing protein [Comamonas sp. NyZ500]
MNAPPLYRLAKLSPSVLAVLGSPEPRIYPWGENTDKTVAYPYATWIEVSGAPYNHLAGRPSVDRTTTQIDVWAKAADPAQAQRMVEEAATALRDAIELDCYITAWRRHPRDPDTKVYRISFDAEWQLNR